MASANQTPGGHKFAPLVASQQGQNCPYSQCSHLNLLVVRRLNCVQIFLKTKADRYGWEHNNRSEHRNSRISVLLLIALFLLCSGRYGPHKFISLPETKLPRHSESSSPHKFISLPDGTKLPRHPESSGPHKFISLPDETKPRK